MNLRRLAAAAAVLLCTQLATDASARPPERKKPRRMRMAMPAPSASMGVTAGGAQDIAHFRDRVKDGQIPHPAVFTPEGLFSEHDLPLTSSDPCGQLLCALGQATDARFIVQPEVRYLGQLGFSTNVDASKFQRPHLNLVAVIDKSGSMSGQLELVKDSLHEVVRQMDADDQLTIVLYGSTTHVHLRTTPITGKTEKKVHKAIDAIVSEGSTAMEDGLKLGLAEAKRSGRHFSGSTRVMLFTDERPNVGRTDAGSFMSMAESASKGGVGMTTIGVGVQFGAELATKISSVRGGNLYFFPDRKEMMRVFEAELDTMVAELAHDVHLRFEPAKGMKLAGIYGIPGEKLQWAKGGALEVDVATMFLSRKDGAIYVAVAPDGSSSLPRSKVAEGDPIASVAVSYTPRAGKREHTRAELTAVRPSMASVGLSRGLLLVDQVTTLKEATRKHHEDNDQEGAYQLVHALASSFRGLGDHDMEPERTLVMELESQLAKLSGHAGEATKPPGKHPITGLPTH